MDRKHVYAHITSLYCVSTCCKRLSILHPKAQAYKDPPLTELRNLCLILLDRNPSSCHYGQSPPKRLKFVVCTKNNWSMQYRAGFIRNLWKWNYTPWLKRHTLHILFGAASWAWLRTVRFGHASARPCNGDAGLLVIGLQGTDDWWWGDSGSWLSGHSTMVHDVFFTNDTPHGFKMLMVQAFKFSSCSILTWATRFLEALLT